jgi:hypothetical protein
MSSKQKTTKQPEAARAAAAAAAASKEDGDVDMTEESDQVAVADFVPSTIITSYLSQKYNPEVENKKVPGFICGRQYQRPACCTRPLRGAGMLTSLSLSFSSRQNATA